MEHSENPENFVLIKQLILERIADIEAEAEQEPPADPNRVQPTCCDPTRAVEVRSARQALSEDYEHFSRWQLTRAERRVASSHVLPLSLVHDASRKERHFEHCLCVSAPISRHGAGQA